MAIVTGTNGNDTIRVGSASAGVVLSTDATNAADSIRALAGADIVSAGAGNDTIRGGDGNDFLSGGADNDSFTFNAVLDSRAGGGDTVAGVDGIGVPGGDVFGLFSIDANTLIMGNQAFTFIGTAAFSTAGQLLRVADAGGGNTRILGNVGGSLAADLEILVQDGPTDPNDYAAGDFIF